MIIKDKTFLKQFNQSIEENFDEFLSLKGFKLESHKIEKYGAERVYARSKQYIVIRVNIHPRDIPEYWNIVMGEGSKEFPEADWNKVPLWSFMKELGQKDAKEYLLVNLGADGFSKQVSTAKIDLEKYGRSFLDNDLDLFYKVRSSINKDREPYKIYSPDKKGNYQVTDDAKSLKLKKKFGG